MVQIFFVSAGMTWAMLVTPKAIRPKLVEVFYLSNNCLHNSKNRFEAFAICAIFAVFLASALSAVFAIFVQYFQYLSPQRICGRQTSGSYGRLTLALTSALPTRLYTL